MRAQHSGTDMPVTHMVVDPAPPPSALSPDDWDLSELMLFDQLLLKKNGLTSLNEVCSVSGEPPFIPRAPSFGAHPEKHGILPPSHPISPLLPIGTPLAYAPSNWRAWIAQCYWTNIGTSNQALGSNSPITLSNLGT